MAPDLNYIPFARVDGRYGASERVEITGSAGLDGLRGGARVQVTNPDDEGVVVTLGATAGAAVNPWASQDDTVTVGAQERVYVGVPVPDAENQLVLTAALAQYGPTTDIGDELFQSSFWYGVGVGWSSTMNAFRFMPELGWTRPTNPDVRMPGGAFTVGVSFALREER